MEINTYIEKIRKFNRYYANVLGKIDQEIYNKPYPLTEARVITALFLQGDCTATEIRETLGLDRGYMSRIIQKFEDENIIMKKKSESDKRQFILSLTVHGKGIYKELVENANIEVEKFIQTLRKNDLPSLVTAMETIEHIYSNKGNTPEVLIRPFRAGDVGYVAYLHGRLYEETYKFGTMFEYYVMKGLTEFMVRHEGGNLWIAEVNGEIIGSIAITKNSDKIAQLRWFVINENYQGMGIGNKLMETAIAFCKEHKYKHVFLWTVNILGAARHLYKKYNFYLSEEKENEEWTGDMLIEERWDLDLTQNN